MNRQHWTTDARGTTWQTGRLDKQETVGRQVRAHVCSRGQNREPGMRGRMKGRNRLGTWPKLNKLESTKQTQIARINPKNYLAMRVSTFLFIKYI